MEKKTIGPKKTFMNKFRDFRERFCMMFLINVLRAAGRTKMLGGPHVARGPQVEYG
jgi:hypothetical protein